MKIYLASRSPRRRELLTQIGIDYELVDVDIDETWDRIEKPADYVCRVAREKAQTAYQNSNKKFPLLAADTAVVLNDRILGKAESIEDAKEMLTKLSGKTHLVLSAVTVIHKEEQTILSTSAVTFNHLSEDDINDYVNTGEPLGKAGGYAIQGRAAIFIKQLVGSYSGVMGLPLFETYELLGPLITERKQ